MSLTSVVDTSEELLTGVNDTDNACFAGVIDTELTPVKHRNNQIYLRIIKKKLKSFLGLSTGPRRNSLMKKTRGKKSRGTVPLKLMTRRFKFGSRVVAAGVVDK